jgi:1-acyl-sn-glycerol-3-phosphate acyltransferase
VAQPGGVPRIAARRALAHRRSRDRHLAYGAYAWSTFGLLCLAALPASLLPAGARWVAMRSLARVLLGASRLRLSVRGLDHLPRRGPAVIVANHASYVDGPLLFALLPRPVRFVAKRELAGNPVVRLLLRAAGVAFIERFDVERSAADTRALAQRARAGEALVFFAEGTFTRAPGLAPFHMGAFVVAAESGAPVVAMALRGTRSVMRDGTWLPRRGAVLVSMGEPRLAEGSDWGAAARLREAVRSEILSACGEPDLAARAASAGNLP